MVRWRTCLQWCVCGGTAKRNVSSAQWINSPASTSAEFCLRRRLPLCSPAPRLLRTWWWARVESLVQEKNVLCAFFALWFDVFWLTGEGAFCHAGGDRYLLCRRYLHRAGDSAASELSPWVYLSGEWAESGCVRSAVAQLDASAQHVPHTPGTGSINVLWLNLLKCNNI